MNSKLQQYILANARARTTIAEREELLLRDGVPSESSWILARAGYSRGQQIRESPDCDILDVLGVGRVRLSRLRRVFPYDPSPPAYSASSIPDAPWMVIA